MTTKTSNRKISKTSAAAFKAWATRRRNARQARRASKARSRKA